jgi:hypothetical protein
LSVESAGLCGSRPILRCGPKPCRSCRPGRAGEKEGATLSQIATEQALGRLISDDAFRDEFYENPEAALDRLRLKLTPVELTALLGIERDIVEVLARRLDDRIRRATGGIACANKSGRGVDL